MGRSWRALWVNLELILKDVNMEGYGRFWIVIFVKSGMFKFSFLSYHHDCNVKNGLEKGEIDGQEQVWKFTAVIQGKDNDARLRFLFSCPSV